MKEQVGIIVVTLCVHIIEPNDDAIDKIFVSVIIIEHLVSVADEKTSTDCMNRIKVNIYHVL